MYNYSITNKAFVIVVARLKLWGKMQIANILHIFSWIGKKMEIQEATLFSFDQI